VSSSSFTTPSSHWFSFSWSLFLPVSLCSRRTPIPDTNPCAMTAARSSSRKPSSPLSLMLLAQLPVAKARARTLAQASMTTTTLSLPTRLSSVSWRPRREASQSTTNPSPPGARWNRQRPMASPTEPRHIMTGVAQRLRTPTNGREARGVKDNSALRTIPPRGNEELATTIDARRTRLSSRTIDDRKKSNINSSNLDWILMGFA
jgi:hypothetical protein